MKNLNEMSKTEMEQEICFAKEQLGIADNGMATALP